MFEESEENKKFAKIFREKSLKDLKALNRKLRWLLDNIIHEKICEKKKSEVGLIEKAISKIKPNEKAIKVISFTLKNVNIWAEETLISTTDEEKGWSSFTISNNEADRQKSSSCDVLLQKKKINLKKYESIRPERDYPIVFANQINVCPYCGFTFENNPIYHPVSNRYEFENSDLNLNLKFLEEVKLKNFSSSHSFKRCYKCKGKTRLQVLEDKLPNPNTQLFKDFKEKIDLMTKKSPHISKDKIERIKKKRLNKKNKNKKEHKEVEPKPIIQTPILEKDLYLMKDNDNGAYKIGVSNNPEFRELTLASQKPSIKLVGSWPKLGANEKKWHEYFKDKRLRGEWFDLTQAQVRFFVHKCMQKKSPPLRKPTSVWI